ncbi:MAG: glycosyltransferase [Acidobacteriaceae bacterium]|nr:glycosyltransferase [Acidobacteriaceae bacterium]
MVVCLRVLFWIAAVGSATSTIYLLLVLAAAARFTQRRRREDHAGDYLPPLSVLKPLHGIDPSLEKNLESFFQQDYREFLPEFELLFCARHETDKGLQLARAIGARYPQVQARYLTCGEPEYPNPKVYSLAVMEKAAKHDLIVTSDADVRISRDLLRRAAQSFRDPKLMLVSCLYLGTSDTSGLVPQLDAVGKSVEMSSGALVSAMLEGGARFALGPLMMQRRQAFARAGGLELMGQYPADDYVMGKRLAHQGERVTLAAQTIRLMVPPDGFRDSFRNQLRWMQMTRRSRRLGHLGTGLTFSVVFGMIGLAWGVLSGQAGLGLLWLGANCLNRWIQAGAVLKALGETRWLRQTVIYPLRDLLGSVMWFASYLPTRVHYHGGRYLLTSEGRYKQVS